MYSVLLLILILPSFDFDASNVEAGIAVKNIIGTDLTVNISSSVQQHLYHGLVSTDTSIHQRGHPLHKHRYRKQEQVKDTLSHLIKAPNGIIRLQIFLPTD